ncbi:hypothetical protein F5Y03DRAFT_404183 [Xylaria venustula]|nr:hypothetical protein F5Y03DRAFT_404183 [Xylaria venustula]
MCIIIYYICSKCFCGFPRFTECCKFMHPPLIYCPRGTQFKFRIVDEKECRLHPHHAPLLHLGANGEDTVLPMSTSGPGPAVEAVTHIPSQEDKSTSKIEEACTRLQTAPVLCQTDSQAPATDNMQKVRNEQEIQQNNHHITGSTENVQPADRDGQSHANGWQQQHASSQYHRCLASHNHSQSEWQTAAPRNWWYNENNFTRNNMAIGVSVPRGNFPSSSFSRYYANGICSRTPFDFRNHPHNGHQYRYYPHQAAPTWPFHAALGPTPPQCTGWPAPCWVPGPRCYQNHPPFYNSASNICANYANTFQLNHANRHTSWNPSLASQAVTFAPHARETPQSILERRRENLEQLRRSNDAAYYHCRHHRNSQSLINSEDDTATETRPSLLPSPQPETPSAKCDCPTAQRAKVNLSRPRSLSEPCTYRRFMGGILPPTTQGDCISYHGDFAQRASYGKENEVVGGPSSAKDNLSPLGTPVHPATPDRTHVKDLQSSNEASLETDCDVSIKQESDDEDYKLGNPIELAPTSVKTDPESEVKLYDIPMVDKGKEFWNRTPAEEIQSDVSGEDWGSAFESPPVPPNSPFSPGKSPIRRQTFDEWSLKRAVIEEFLHERQLQPSFSDREARLDDRHAAAIPTPSKDLSSNSSIKSYEMLGSDLSENIPLAQNLGPKSGRTWSAVVSGSYVPSKSSDPFPATTKTPVRIDHATSGTNTHGSMLENPARSSNSRASTAKTQHELPHNSSTAVPPPIRPMFPTNTWAHPTTPPNSPANPALKSTIPQKPLEMLRNVLERRNPSISSLGSDDFTTMTSTTIHSETDETASTPISQPGQSAQSANLLPSTVSSPQTNQATPVAPAPASATTDIRSSPQPRAWSQLFQKTGGSKRISNSKPRSESNTDDTVWPPLGSHNPNARKRNTSS